MRIPTPRAPRRARVEIIPLIDIIFFLLAAFVMVSLSMVRSKGLPVNLPAAANGAAEPRGDAFTTITITARNVVFLNREQVPLSELESRLHALKRAQPDPRVYLNGDTDSRLGTAIAVLDTLRKTGITRVAFETQPAPLSSAR